MSCRVGKGRGKQDHRNAGDEFSVDGELAWLAARLKEVDMARIL